MGELENEALEELYQWIDKIPLSRPKKNLGRDFSDGVLVAEVVRHFFPRMVELHNYTPANSTGQKVVNWHTLNRKLFNKLGFSVPEEMIHALVTCKPGEMEHLISNLKARIESEQVRRKFASKPALDQEPGYVAAAARAAQREQQQRLARGADPRNRRRHNSRHQSAEPVQQEELGSSEFVLPSISDPGYSTGHVSNSFWLNGSSSLEPSPRQVSSLPGHLPAIGSSQHTMTSLPAVRERHHTANRSWQTLEQDMNLVLEEKEQTILELQETVQLLQLKVRRLEHLLRVKDLRIDDLTQRLQVIVSDKPPPGKRL